MTSLRNHTATLFILALGASASAQDTTATPSPRQEQSAFARRTSFVVSALQSRPQGDLARNIGIGYGGEGTMLYALDEAGILSLRASAGIIQYGSEVNSTSFSGGAAGRVRLDVKTSNYIVPMSLGPQLTWPSGLVRPYVNAGVGGQAYFTESTVESDRGSSVIASTTNQSDLSFAWTAGGGLGILLPVRSRIVSLDFGVQYMHGGETRYLSEGSITDLPTGIIVSPMQSTTHVVMVKFGARIGL